jgi:hypothetical protein
MTEKELQKLILDYLAVKRIFHYRNNSGVMFSEYKGKKRMVRFGATGSPDIIVVQNGIYVGIEVKNATSVQNEAQVEFQQALEKAGGRYILARSLDDVIQNL